MQSYSQSEGQGGSTPGGMTERVAAVERDGLQLDESAELVDAGAGHDVRL